LQAFQACVKYSLSGTFRSESGKLQKSAQAVQAEGLYENTSSMGVLNI
jgi:hypothetical protein